MVASYSPTQTHRSGSITPFLTKVATGLRDAFTQLPDHQGLPKSDVLFSTQVKSQLATLPNHTFGHQWLTFTEQNSHLALNNHSDHATDGLHILTGYDADLMGKAELHAFLWGATSHITSLCSCIGTFRTLHNSYTADCSSLSTGEAFSRLYQAYQRGRTSYFEFKNWHPEQLWDLPVQYVRQWFGIAEP